MTHPKPVVGVLVYNDVGQILLVTSHKWKGKWIVPGGHVEWGETLIECCKREVKEETNLDITDVKNIQVQENVLSDEFYEPRHMVFLNFIARAAGNDIVLNEELQEYVWIEPQKALDKLDMNSTTRGFVKEYMKSR